MDRFSDRMGFNGCMNNGCGPIHPNFAMMVQYIGLTCMKYNQNKNSRLTTIIWKSSMRNTHNSSKQNKQRYKLEYINLFVYTFAELLYNSLGLLCSLLCLTLYFKITCNTAFTRVFALSSFFANTTAWSDVHNGRQFAISDQAWTQKIVHMTLTVISLYQILGVTSK